MSAVSLHEDGGSIHHRDSASSERAATSDSNLVPVSSSEHGLSPRVVDCEQDEEQTDSNEHQAESQSVPVAGQQNPDLYATQENDSSERNPDAGPLLIALSQGEEQPSSLQSTSVTLGAREPLLRDVRFGQVGLLSPWFPEVDPKHKRARGWRTWHSRREVVLWTAFSTSTTVLLVNIILVAVLSAKYDTEYSSKLKACERTAATDTQFDLTVKNSCGDTGVVPLYEGHCTVVKNWGIGAHVGINILSTILLGASNLCMQLLVAPTRDEVDKAHQKKLWLDIGVPSWRNLKFISRGRRVMWFCLGFSSVPLHFIYNSAISTSIPVYGYAAVVASENFLHGAPIGNWTNVTSAPNKDDTYNPWLSSDVWDYSQEFLHIRSNALNSSAFQNLSNKQCIEKYSDTFAARSSLIIVTEELPSDANASVHQYIFWGAEYGGWSHYYPCEPGPEDNPGGYGIGEEPEGPSCITLSSNTQAQYDNWKKFNRTVLYCLSEFEQSGHCRINYSPGIFIVVCCFSTLKCLCILITVFWHKQPTLSTIGDAIVSFLEVPDDVSAHMGFVAKSAFRNSLSPAWTDVPVIPWHAQMHRWYSIPSKRRWIVTMFLCALAIIVALASAIPGSRGTHIRNHTKTFSWQMKQGLGVADPDAFTAYFLPRYGTVGFIANVIWANIWQIIISFLYLAYNALLTSMLVGDEWSRYTTERKTLRVTHPRGIQRSSYFISMPYKYGIPLMAANSTLHWLVSQSTFIVSAVAYLPNHITDTQDSYTVTGYSTKAAIISICFGTALTLILFLISFQKVHGGIPLASTCSIAISAACHRPAEDEDACLLPVRWGVITAYDESPAKCAFTTLREVRLPQEGERIGGEGSVRVQWQDTPKRSRLKRWFDGFKKFKWLRRRKME